MEFFDLVDISERYIELVNPSTSEKVITVGKFLGLTAGSRVIEFGCGFGEILALWATHFGISGLGIDVRENACTRARKKMARLGLDERIEIVQGSAADFSFEESAYDAAACIGASFIWGGYRPAIQAMKPAIHAGGRLAIGEPYWRKERVPPAYSKAEADIYSESELLQLAREEGFDLAYLVRASHDDWDRYESDNWHGLLDWIKSNPDHPELAEVVHHLHKIQDEYLRYGREYLGWAMHVLNPIDY